MVTRSNVRQAQLLADQAEIMKSQAEEIRRLRLSVDLLTTTLARQTNYPQNAPLQVQQQQQQQQAHHIVPPDAHNQPVVPPPPVPPLPAVPAAAAGVAQGQVPPVPVPPVVPPPQAAQNVNDVLRPGNRPLLPDIPTLLPNTMEILLSKYEEFRLERFRPIGVRTGWAPTNAMMFNKWDYLFSKILQKARNPNYKPNLPRRTGEHMGVRMRAAAKSYDDLRHQKVNARNRALSVPQLFAFLQKNDPAVPKRRGGRNQDI
jgi:hypothetical protein